MVNGQWQVVDGRHVNKDLANAAYRDTVAQLGATLGAVN
jgi:hypothetical protein